MNLNELTITQSAAGIRRREFSVAELISACLDAIADRDTEIHAYLDIFEDDARSKAAEADLEISKYRSPTGSGIEISDLPPLFGIPIAIKDNILVEGRRSTAGSRILENYVASYDAAVIRKLKEQGAIILGKTNLDEFAMGSSTENSAFGPTRNPHDSGRVPGGSSGGSAAAVAADMTIAALGSDTGGSIRQPASFCGIVGMKPTYGAVSRHGLIAMASSLDQIGPMAKTVADAEILFRAIAGEDAFDATAAGANRESRIANHGIKNTRIGMPREYFGAGLDPDIEKIVKSAIRKMEAAGAKIEEINLPHSEYALPAYYIIVPSEVSANLARFDGIRYGRHTTYVTRSANLCESYAKTRAEGFGAEVKRRIMLGTYALSAGYYDAYYLKAQKVRRLIRMDFEKAFHKVDVIVGPTASTPAFLLGERAGDPLQMYLADIYTVAVNLAGLPALSLPVGKVRLGAASLPVGLQLIAPWFAESALFSLAEEVELLLK